MKIKNLLILAAISTMLFSCGTNGEDIPYMSNIDQIPSAALSSVVAEAGDFTIKPGDLLLINVSSSNEESVKPFNKMEYVPTLGSGTTGMGDRNTLYYLVDDNGNIEFPILGTLHVKGMTKKSVEEYVRSLIYPRYLNEVPGVECLIQNFRIFCLGEFSHGGVISAENGRLNLIEAIALAGDLTMQARRDNIMLIRTDANGQRTVKRIDVRDAMFMTQPEFNLQQNDILYAEPNIYKKRSVWSLPPVYSAGVGIFGTVVSVVTFITVLAKK